ncbi:MAG: prolipoprotein diacylglyceryl transferase, partial [Candidatus Pacearchaeota archaeon]|nr:prolipoprotein diacylglyceryl transferase [Candidatus Pacearchaeota archaeon]
GNVKIFSWGVFFAFSFLLAFVMAWREVKGKIEKKDFLNIALLILFGILIGIRLLYVLFNFSYYETQPLKIFAFQEGGSFSYGGFLALF